ncbi:hypothetical protein CFAM422_008289 [Trichoderma lentiforme]|uniref:Uncharacterized protein n=1 Tax=Trichoderma lentiforme TaxID=1567552 RepID=A0A9P4XCZ1_9HYPO|nr:hypothetical protein CFAM422_008289 [Trichoderma lentiforme]
MQVAARRQVPGWDTKSCSDGEVPVRVAISSYVSNIVAFNPFIDMEVKLQTAAKM